MEKVKSEKKRETPIGRGQLAAVSRREGIRCGYSRAREEREVRCLWYVSVVAITCFAIL
jgi:hypothetical protein